MPENKWDKYLEKGEQKSKWDKYVVEEDSKKKAQSDSIPVPNISDEVLATGFVSPSSVPSSATLSPLEIPRPQGQSEKVRVEAAPKPKEEKPKRKDQLIIGDEAPVSSKVKKMEEFYDEDVKRNAVNALQELSQHPRAIFDKWRTPILSACRENLRGFVPIPNTYETCQVAVMSRGNVYW